MNVSTGGGRRLRNPATLATLVLALSLMSGPGYAAPGEPDPRGRSIEEVRAELDGLYRTAEAATEAYNAANEKATKQEKRLKALRKDLVRAEDRVEDLQKLSGAAARTQYRGGNLAATGIQLLLGEHPDQALNEASQARQALRSLANVAETHKAARAELDRRTDSAEKELRKLEDSRADKAEAKKRIEGKIAEAERVEAGLEAEEARELARLERQRAKEAEARWTASVADGGTSAGTGSAGNGGSGGSGSRGSGGGGGGPVGGGTQATGAAAKAVAFAMAQIGKPYGWGAVGPSAYDCSGLTSVAWARAGHPIPRTSQAQWAGLPRVSLASARPGDLIIFFDDATHVGMYIGNGKMVHAPRPGRTITTAPAASMSILGVVRPGA